MIYAVSGRLVDERRAEFHRKLTDGTIAAQRPDGGEIVASMRRARVSEDGIVRWTELCFCATPLQHERDTVLDHYFSEIETEPVDAHSRFSGAPLMDMLAISAERDR